MPDSPSTTPATPTNTVDLAETEAMIKAKITEQATARADWVDTLIQWHHIIVVLDTYCDSLQQYQELWPQTSSSDPTDRLAAEKKCKELLATWVSTLKDANLPHALKALPQEVSIDARLSLALGCRADNIIMFQRIFKAFLSGPVALSSVVIEDSDTWFEYQEALRYAVKKERIQIKQPILSSIGG